MRAATLPPDRKRPRRRRRAAGRRSTTRPVEFWPTSAIRAALETDDLTVWQRIVVAIKRDPYGRTARQVEEVLETARPYGVSKALSEVLTRTREHLEANERAEVAPPDAGAAGAIGSGPAGVRVTHRRSGRRNSRRTSSGETSPPASLMVRMRRLSDRFAKMRNQRH